MLEVRRGAQRIECGRFYLVPPNAKKPFWKIGWYDAATEQTKLVAARPDDHPKGFIRGMRAEDVKAATEALLRWANEHPQMPQRETDASRAGAMARDAVRNGAALNPESAPAEAARAEAMRESAPRVVPQKDLPLTTVLLHYRAVRGARMKSQSIIVDTLRTCMEVWGDVTCRELTPSRQEHFVAQLRKQGLRDWTIVTRLKCVWAAMRFAVRKEYLSRDAVPERVQADQWDPPAHLPSREATLTDEQIVRMFQVAARHEHWWRWIIMQVGTVSRPLAVCGVDAGNVDWDVGNLRLLEKWKEGVQTKKRKAIVRCCPTLLAWLTYWAREPKSQSHDPHFITYQGRRIRSMHFHRVLAKEAGVPIPKTVGSYIWRHTLVTWLARHGVPEVQRNYMSGHKLAKGSQGGYTHFEPQYLQEACAALEKLFDYVRANLPEGSRSLRPPVIEALSEASQSVVPVSLEDQPEVQVVDREWAYMLRSGTYLVEPRGYPVARLFEKLSEISELRPGFSTLTSCIET